MTTEAQGLSDPGPVNEVSNEHKEMIGTYMALASVATEPGQVYIMTHSFYNAVMTGLTAKYGFSLRGLDDEILMLVCSDIVYMEAPKQQGNGFTWGTPQIAFFAGTDIEVPISNAFYTLTTVAEMLCASASHWGKAVPMLKEVHNLLGRICVAEDMLECKIVTSKLSEEMERIRAISADAEQEADDRERPFGR